METRFILPVTVAAAVHALALLGFNGTPAIRPERPATIHSKPPVEATIEDPIEPLPGDPDAKSQTPKAAPENFTPRLDEPISAPSDFVQPVAPVRSPATTVATRIPSGPVIVTDGPGDGGSDRSIFDARLLDRPPHTRSQVPPNYPADAKSVRLNGNVLVEFVVDENGRVSNARVLRASDARFEAATLRAVEKWRFEPGRKNGRPVKFRMTVPVVFGLEG